MSRSATSTHFLKTSREGDSTTALGSCFQCLTNVVLVVRGPKLNTACEVQPHQCLLQGDDHFVGPAGHTIPDTSQDAVGLLGHPGTLLAHVPRVPEQYLRHQCSTLLICKPLRFCQVITASFSKFHAADTGESYFTVIILSHPIHLHWPMYSRLCINVTDALTGFLS